MTTKTPDQDPTLHDSDDTLRWALRSLRNDVPPRRELWDGIAARIAHTPQHAVPTPRPQARRPLALFAMAATLVLAVGLGWQLRPQDGGDPGVPVAPASQAALLAAEADAMTREYEGALREVESAAGFGATPPALSVLDANAATVRAALAQAPDSRFLFERLQRLYAQRLALTQRLANA